jgi:hypothetical protein
MHVPATTVAVLVPATAGTVRAVDEAAACWWPGAELLRSWRCTLRC